MNRMSVQVENHILEMILANLEVSRPAEITEMCLKMLNDLTSQEGIGKSVASTDRLIRFPIISKCGKIACSVEQSANSDQEEDFTLNLEDFHGGPDSFLLAARFCYGVQVELTPRNVVGMYCAATTSK
ncbi:hypothetical protein MLD38_008269 [Melastoma candidum]|uniref:Uncharacterized protein n=1 Tax=Melastoma candidum TaxID=119954 RepID=A0ACB9RTE4_9MYRT|nr:hypothetical protein MLD38_008269 [Melastoma candidum]